MTEFTFQKGVQPASERGHLRMWKEDSRMVSGGDCCVCVSVCLCVSREGLSFTENGHGRSPQN